MYAQEKNEKKPQAYRLTVCASRKRISSAPGTCLHSVNSCNPRRNTPNGRRVQSGSLRLRARTSQPHELPARRMLACRAKREQTTVGSRGYALPSRRLRVRDGSLGDSFRRFLVGEKTTSLFSFAKERDVFFSLRKEKNEKKPQAYRLTVCAAGSGSVAAMKDGVHAHFVRVIRQPPPFASIAPEDAHTARALRLRARSFQSQLLPARRVPPWLAYPLRCANTCREPCVYASQQKYESPRRESR